MEDTKYEPDWATAVFRIRGTSPLVIHAYRNRSGDLARIGRRFIKLQKQFKRKEAEAKQNWMSNYMY